MSEIPKILTKTKRVELLVQSEKIRFSTREEAADLKVRLFTSLKEFVRCLIFLIFKLENSTGEEGSLQLLPWPGFFRHKEWVGPSKRRQNLLPKVRRLVIYCPPAF